MATSSSPQISIILTVYNKAAFLPATLDSLAAQQDPGSLEIILVDDASTDDSCAVAERCLARWPHHQLIRNDDNRGPSVRLNQGARAANCDWLFFVDSDDIVVDGAFDLFQSLLQQYEADLVYARRSGNAVTRPLHPDVLVSDDPLSLAIKKKVVHVCVLTRKSLFERSGGCDERIFIQDESLALSLAASASRMVLINNPMCFDGMDTPQFTGGNRLSGDKPQQHHDQFLTYWHLRERVSEHHLQLINQKLVSAWWKSARQRLRGFEWFMGGLRYAFYRQWSNRLSNSAATAMFEYFNQLPDVRRPAT